MSLNLIARLPRGLAPLSSLSIPSSSLLSRPSLSSPSLTPSRPLSSHFTPLSSSLPPKTTPFLSFPSPVTPIRFSSTSSPSSPEGKDGVVIDINAQNINNIMQEKGVLVLYCTADWCGPCKKLGPRLEEDIKALPGVRLGKIDIDKEQQLAGAMRIQSIPAVFSFNDGKLIDSFVGVPPDQKYNEFFNGIKEHIPAQSGDSEVNYDQVLKDADQILEEGNVEEAAKMYSEVFESHNTKDDDLFGAMALSGLVQCVIKQGEVEAAKSLVSNLKSKYKGCLEHPAVRLALNTFELMSSASDSSSPQISLEELEKIVQEDPNKMEEKLELAKLYFVSNRPEDSIKMLLDMIKRDRHWNENAAKEQLLKIFEVLGPSHELTISGRRRLTSVWF